MYKVIRLVAEENQSGGIEVKPRTVELYDVIIEDKNARLSASPENRFTDLSGGARLSAAPDNGLADLLGLSSIPIREMLSGVKDYSGAVYYNQQARGSIAFPVYDGAPVPISLGRGADRSTFTHELAHLYLWHLKRLAATATEMNGGSWRGPEARWNTDLKAVPRWWDEQAGDIARGFRRELSASGRSAV